MKIGDRIYCFKDAHMQTPPCNRVFTAGKEYRVISVSTSSFRVVDDAGHSHSLTLTGEWEKQYFRLINEESPGINIMEVL